jgi:hypothetical protein
MPEQELFTIIDAAKILGTTEGALRARVQRREIPIVKFGYRTVIAKDIINKILRGESVKPS